jgi:hypothetical protein
MIARMEKVKILSPLPFLLVLATLLSGCAGMAERSSLPPAPERRASDLGGLEKAAAAKDEPGSPQHAAEKRILVYDGSCKLMVNDIEETKKDIELEVQKNGGYVESSTKTQVLLRVPAERFRKTFTAILALGEVLDKSIETTDVTDALRDQQTRMQLAERARQRLYQLLEKTTRVQEQLAILREIRRLTEQIEQIRLSLSLLESRVAFSRITVSFEPRLVEETGRTRIPFPWIAALQPVYPSIHRKEAKVSLDPGDDFAILAKEGAFRAESPEGTRVRIGSVANEPRGDEVFWEKALGSLLGPRYRSAEPVEAGPFRGVLFTSKDSRPFSYFVGVAVHERTLVVLEVFFPNQEARQQRFESLRLAMEKGRVE